MARARCSGPVAGCSRRAWVRPPDQVPAESHERWLATLDFGLTYERAVLDWFDRLPEAMTTPNDNAPNQAGGGSVVDSQGEA